MAEVFADTAGWASFFVLTEPHHAVAEALIFQWHGAGTKLVTTNYVLAELVSLFTSPLRIPRSWQIQTIETIRSTPWVEVIHIDRLLDTEAWQLLKTRQDKDWSIVDCASFVVMKQRGITEALTTDRHFEQAGFLRHLK